MDSPWQHFSDKHGKDDRVTGVIKSITDFGIFIGLEGGIDGLVHLNDISWNQTGEAAIRDFKKGQELEAIVLAVDPERERISLGLKQLEHDPFGQYTEAHPKGSIVEGVAVEVDAKGVKVELTEGVYGYLRAAEISRERVKDASEHFNVGDTVSAKYLSVDRKTRMLTLSVKARDAGEEEEALKKLSDDSSTKATLGDLLKEQMNNGDDAGSPEE